jgi:hypothetical protein
MSVLKIITEIMNETLDPVIYQNGFADMGSILHLKITFYC